MPGINEKMSNPRRQSTDMPSGFITGLGAISAAGDNTAETLLSLETGGKGPGPVTLFDTDLDRPVFEVKNLPGKLHGDRRLTSRTAHLAFLAAREALRSARDPHRDPALNIGVCLGTTVASQLNNLPFYTQYRESGKPDLGPVRDYLDCNLAATIADIFGCRGPRTTVVNACSSGADAIGTALSWLGAGICDAVITGGADELNRVPLCGFNSLGIMSEKPCRPFDRSRDGLNLGEGAGILIIESERCAERRKVKNALVVSGYGSACDAHHLTAPHPEGAGLKLAIESALERSGLFPEDISFVNAHGTATPDNDRIEGGTLCGIFGAGIRYFSTKGLTGHTLGAAGGLEAVFTALNLREGWIPQNAGCCEPDTDIPVPPVMAKTPINGNAALSTSLAFGGNNAALLFQCSEQN